MLITFLIITTYLQNKYSYELYTYNYETIAHLYEFLDEHESVMNFQNGNYTPKSTKNIQNNNFKNI